MARKLTVNGDLVTMEEHASDKGSAIYSKYGPCITDKVLYGILEDKDCCLFPVEIIYDSNKVPQDSFAKSEPKSNNYYNYLYKMVDRIQQ